MKVLSVIEYVLGVLIAGVTLLMMIPGGIIGFAEIGRYLSIRNK